MSSPEVHIVHVFVDGPGGGNPAPIVLDARGMSPRQMQEVARSSGHESGFVFPAEADEDLDYHFRFWVPNHEMSMCGHVTVGAVWLLNQLGLLRRSELRIGTVSGVVEARVVAEGGVEVTQPAGSVETVTEEVVDQIVDVLGITRAELAERPVRNAATSRVKTLVPIASPEILDRLTPDFSRVEEVCALANSTGLYPYAVSDPGGQVFDARQFPRSSGYPEDAATGIAAAALVYGLLADGLVDGATESAVRVRQGRAMGRPSQIQVKFRGTDGLWLGGRVQ